jgi:phenylacetaldehyde dehydrogenase
VAEIGQSIKLAPGTDPDAQMGPLISDEQFDKVLGYLDSGRSEGAEAVIGGARQGDRGYFVQPTILTKTNPDMKVVREEIFGPVVCAIPFNSPDDIVRGANDTSYGLAAGVFTRDISKAHRTAKRLRAGTVWINTYHVFDAAMPFGGYKESGWGREMGPQVLENYLETKSVVTAL